MDKIDCCVRRPCVKGNKIHGPRYFDRQLFRIILSFPQMDNYFISLNIICFIEIFDGTGSASTTNGLVPIEKSHILQGDISPFLTFRYVIGQCQG